MPACLLRLCGGLRELGGVYFLAVAVAAAATACACFAAACLLNRLIISARACNVRQGKYLSQISCLYFIFLLSLERFFSR